MQTLRGVIRKYMEILEKNIILGSADALPNMIFFKDPIYFRITPLSVYITNNTWYPKNKNKTNNPLKCRMVPPTLVCRVRCLD